MPEILDSVPSLIPAAFFSGLGSWLVGSFISTLLEGMLLLQTIHYFRIYPQDPLYLKIWVAITVLLQTAAVALSMHTCYYYMVTNYFKPAVLFEAVVVSATATTVIGRTNILIVEIFFVRRVWLVGKQYRKYTIFPIMAIIAGTVCYFVLSAGSFTAKNLAADVTTGSYVGGAISSSVLLLVADIQLTGVLIYALHTSRTGMQRTSSMINLLILYTISTGLMICIFNIGAVILSAIMPHDVIWTVFFIVGQQVYSNSLVVALTSRRFIQKHGDVTNSDSHAFRSPPGTNNPGSATMELGSYTKGGTTTTFKDTMTTGSVAALQFGMESIIGPDERDVYTLSKLKDSSAV